jgi:hypothetical protein
VRASWTSEAYETRKAVAVAIFCRDVGRGKNVPARSARPERRVPKCIRYHGFVELWGAQLFGAPCRACAFDWSLSAQASIAFVEGLPVRARSIAEQGKGDERLTPQAWSVSGYNSHVADNARTWAERLHGALPSEITMVSGYDPDAVAAARKCKSIPLSSALWSLENSCDAWVKTLTAALAEKIELEHVTRGRQRAQDIARNNAHDAHHTSGISPGCSTSNSVRTKIVRSSSLRSCGLLPGFSRLRRSCPLRPSRRSRVLGLCFCAIPLRSVDVGPQHSTALSRPDNCVRLPADS